MHKRGFEYDYVWQLIYREVCVKKWKGVGENNSHGAAVTVNVHKERVGFMLNKGWQRSGDELGMLEMMGNSKGIEMKEIGDEKKKKEKERMR